MHSAYVHFNLPIYKLQPSTSENYTLIKTSKLVSHAFDFLVLMPWKWQNGNINCDSLASYTGEVDKACTSYMVLQ